MTNKDVDSQTTKQPGWFESSTNRIIAAVGILTTLMAALVGLLDNFEKLADKARHVAAGFSRQAPPVDPPPSGATVPLPDPQPTPPAREAGPLPPRREAQHAAAVLFVTAPPGNDGTLIGARARKVLEQEGFALASDRGAAGFAIEIAPPVFGPARTLPSSGLTITSVTATLNAAVVPTAGAAAAGSPLSREVVGRGDGEEAARRDAVIRAADQLGERIAAALRPNAAGEGSKR